MSLAESEIREKLRGSLSALNLDVPQIEETITALLSNDTSRKIFQSSRSDSGAVDFKGNIERLVTSLNKLGADLSQSAYVAGAIKQPSLFYQNPETILLNIIGEGEVDGKKRTGIVTQLCQKLGYAESSKEAKELLTAYVAGAIKNPTLFYRDPETILLNIIGEGEVDGKKRTGIVTQLCQKLGYMESSKEAKELLSAYVAGAIKSPTLFSQNPETILLNIIGEGEVDGKKRTGIVTQLCQKLGYAESSKEAKELLTAYVAGAIKSPTLFHRDPETVMAVVEAFWNISDRLSERGYVFPKPMKREEHLSSKELIILRMCNAPQFFAMAQDRILRAELVLAQQLDPKKIKNGEVTMATIVRTAGKVIKDIESIFGNGEVEVKHPSVQDSELDSWTPAEKKNFAARILAQVGSNKEKLVPNLVAAR